MCPPGTGHPDQGARKGQGGRAARREPRAALERTGLGTLGLVQAGGWPLALGGAGRVTSPGRVAGSQGSPWAEVPAGRGLRGLPGASVCRPPEGLLLGLRVGPLVGLSSWGLALSPFLALPSQLPPEEGALASCAGPAPGAVPPGLPRPLPFPQAWPGCAPRVGDRGSVLLTAPLGRGPGGLGRGVKSSQALWSGSRHGGARPGGRAPHSERQLPGGPAGLAWWHGAALTSVGLLGPREAC